MRSSSEGSVDIILVLMRAWPQGVFGDGAEELAWDDEGGERHGYASIR